MGSEVVGGLFWLAVGIVFAVGGIMLGLGKMRNPGPGFLPLMMALLLICFSLFLLVRGLTGTTLLSALKGLRWKTQGLMVASVFLYGFLLNLLGFLLSTFVLMWILFKLSFQNKSGWSKVLFCAAVTALIGWLVFSVALRVPFPRGQLFAIGR
jgi:hypothetical protein